MLALPGWLSPLPVYRGPRHCLERARPKFDAMRSHLWNRPNGVEFMAAESNEIWHPGSTLRVRFLDGSISDQRRVIEEAREWERYANISLRWTWFGPAEIRVTLEPGPSWSLIGTDALAVPQNQPTMQLGWSDRATTLHEFGHALGLIHEHQSPAADIPWNKAAVYAMYAAPPNGWDAATVDAQVFARYSGNVTNTAWDAASIMEYPIDPALVTDPSYAVGWNQDLSPTDTGFIAYLYPRGPK